MNAPGKPVLDATAVLALIQDEPGAASLMALLPGAVVGSVNAAEVLAKLIARGLPREAALAAFESLHLEVMDFGPRDAATSSAYVQKNVSLGNRCFLASAARFGVGWTSDRVLAALPENSRPRLKLFR